VVEMAVVGGWVCPNAVQTDGAAYGGRNESTRQGGGVKSEQAGAEGMGKWRPMAVRHAVQAGKGAGH
jgi:hypothetical protein